MLRISTIEIPYNKLLVRLGYLQTKTKLDEKTAVMIKETLSLAQKLIKPKAVVAFENIATISGNKTSNEISFENGYKIKSGNIAKLLKNCFKVYGIGITVGGALELRIDEFLKKKETFNALISDAAGSVAAEETINLANAQIKAYEEKNGNMVTRRYSPGYGDWILEDNRQFLNWIGAEHIGIKLNEFCHMKPEKSVSALIGVAKGWSER
ncbi:cobalamin-dependent methionine synthase [Candidatus Endomicrobiellum trichonymphae]|uniref:MetH-domain protein n=1 Tax=Endomicrobium trichonymphae TaxID=1408204 RepID=B1H0N6_ENDTX|nr:cobalamin-dependent methionine synthase [Candidatus Endomicrobium trichonymphae]BAG14068.1 MetH-domain protein [Candidatus Endomicrobium trichonymphae]